MIEKILVAVPIPDQGYYIFDQALTLAKAMNACLGILHVTDPDETNYELPSYLKNLEPYMGGEDESEPYCYMGDFAAVEPDLFGFYISQASAIGVRTNCIHCFGDPEVAINEFAAVWDADLIILGRRGRSGIAEFFLGSVSNYTLHHAPCSVYIVHEPHDARTKLISSSIDLQR